MLATHMMDEAMIEVLEEIHNDKQGLFPKKITSVNNLKAMYQVFSSLKRSSNSHALDI